MDSLKLPLCGLAAVLSLLYLRPRRSAPGNGSIPLIMGSDSNPFSSYLGAWRAFADSLGVVQHGYEQNRTGVFRVPGFWRWEYVANGLQRALEIAAAPEDVLSFQAAAEEGLQSDWTMGKSLTRNPYHVNTIRAGLTRNIARSFPQVREEMVHAFDFALGLEGEEWKLVAAMPMVMQIVARTSNRVFVGLPLCRNPEYLQLNIDYTIDIVTRGGLIRLLPDFLKPLLAPLLSSKNSSLRHALTFMRPILQERIDMDAKHGKEWADRPNDFISWLIDDLPATEEPTVEDLALRILAVNMAAIHTSSTTLTAALYDLAKYPEYLKPLREEVERVTEAEGWTKASLGNMHQIDSFLRESQRLHGSGSLALFRQVVAKDGFTFSDGITIPYGSFLGVPASSVQLDPEFYENPDTFDAFRFSRLRETSGTFNRLMVTTNARDHLVFGHGRHACPGRFFAAAELKAMLAHVVLNYDVKAEVPGVGPPDAWFGTARFANPKGKIWVRKRV
ncbi:unnamed protein product [Mycena citricolor]|uniref:Cytochrome P450 n=1 Tax=Mycena citricolor TaxID=2018698 RepID=A0AAD2HYF5_9AGAR|nr:unnamed protein product [Mycena citricolor]